jgi:hypothetical protein
MSTENQENQEFNEPLHNTEKRGDFFMLFYGTLLSVGWILGIIGFAIAIGASYRLEK